MNREVKNPLVSSSPPEDELAEKSTELAGLCLYLETLQRKDKIFQTYSHADFVRAVYLNSSPADIEIFKNAVNGTDHYIEHYKKFASSTTRRPKNSAATTSAKGGGSAQTRMEKKPRRKSVMERLGLLSPQKKAAAIAKHAKKKHNTTTSNGNNNNTTNDHNHVLSTGIDIDSNGGLLSALKSKISLGRRISCHLLIHLLDSSTEVVSITEGTTVMEVHMAMSHALGIDEEISDECLGLYEYTSGMFRILDDDEIIIERILTWNQEHMNDTTSRIVFKRKSYRRHDALEMAERACKDRKNSVHKMLAGSVIYHTTRGLYPISNGQAFAFAAAALYSKSGGKSSAKAMRSIKKATKKHTNTIFPPHLQSMTKPHMRMAVRAITEEYSKMRGLDMLEVEQVICRNVRAWTNVYGASFYPVKCKKAKEIGNAEIHFEVAIMAVSYEHVTCHVYGNTGTIMTSIVIPFDEINEWNQHDLMVRKTEKLMLIGLLAEDHETGGLFVESIVYQEIMKTLDRYKKLHEKYDEYETAEDSGSQVKVSRRASVKMTASSILDDIGDAFDESNWGAEKASSAEDEDEEEDEEEESSEEESGEEEDEDEEIWDEVQDTATKTKYFVGRQSRRRYKLAHPSSFFLLVDCECVYLILFHFLFSFFF